jgi:hypothetical protein
MRHLWVPQGQTTYKKEVNESNWEKIILRRAWKNAACKRRNQLEKMEDVYDLPERRFLRSNK